MASLPSPGVTETVRWIVFPKYDPSIEPALTPVPRPTALRRLLAESYVDRRDLDRDKVESLVRWMRSVDCYDLTVSTLDDAVDRLRLLMQRAVSA